jgi:hypothetical protein
MDIEQKKAQRGKNIFTCEGVSAILSLNPMLMSFSIGAYSITYLYALIQDNFLLIRYSL